MFDKFVLVAELCVQDGKEHWHAVAYYRWPENETDVEHVLACVSAAAISGITIMWDDLPLPSFRLEVAKGRLMGQQGEMVWSKAQQFDEISENRFEWREYQGNKHWRFICER